MKNSSRRMDLLQPFYCVRFAKERWISPWCVKRPGVRKKIDRNQDDKKGSNPPRHFGHRKTGEQEERCRSNERPIRGIAEDSNARKKPIKKKGFPKTQN